MAYSLIGSWSRWWRTRGRSETTLRNYSCSLSMFVRDVLGGDEMALLDVDRGTLESYVDRRLRKSANAADSDVGAFRSFFGGRAETMTRWTTILLGGCVCRRLPSRL
jgi:site-specific recombinase XerD